MSRRPVMKGDSGTADGSDAGGPDAERPNPSDGLRRRFVSEAIRPIGDHTVDTAALASGEPSLPSAFRWRKNEVAVAEVLEQSRGLREEGFSGEMYLKRHQWKLRMVDGTIWEVYFERQGKPNARAPRWFLKTVESSEDSG